MQMIQFYSASGSAGQSTRAVAPVVHQEKLAIAVGAGAAYQDLLAAIAAGSCAADAGQLSNKGCYAIRLAIDYVTGDDCDECTTPDTLVLETIEVDVPANASFPLPPGLVARIQVATIDADGAFIANTSEQNVTWYSAYAPACTGCVQVPAA